MSMIQTGVAASMAARATQTSGKVQAIRPVAKQNNGANIGGLLNGSVPRPGAAGGVAGNKPMGLAEAIGQKGLIFGALSMGGAAADKTKVAAIGQEYQNGPKAGAAAVGAAFKKDSPQAKDSGLLGKLFGMNVKASPDAKAKLSPVAQLKPVAAQNGTIDNPNVKGNNFDADRHNEKSEDKKLTEALALDSVSILANAA